MPKLLYQGHASLRITSDKGVVIYIDPYAGTGYDVLADIILVTHQHEDHNQTHLVARKPKCRIITEQEALADGRYNTFRIRNVNIRAMPATNERHDPRECVGYLITVDGVKIYVAGDTSETDAMDELIWEKLDYALLPTDGVTNMNTVHATICAALIGARYSIPIHMKHGALFDMEIARRFDVPSRLIVQPGEEIELYRDV